MKSLFLAVMFTLTSLMASHAQGSLNFNNFVPAPLPGVNAPIFDVNGSTGLSGTSFLAQLYAGPNLGSIVALGAAVPFETGPGAGYVTTAPDATRIVPGMAAGLTAVVVVRAWDAAHATYETASTTIGAKAGQSLPINVVLGGAPPPSATVPANLVGLASFSLVTVVPEPSVIALGILGAAAVILRRRKA